MSADESTMLYGCLAVTQDMSMGMPLELPPNLAADGTKVREIFLHLHRLNIMIQLYCDGA